MSENVVEETKPNENRETAKVTPLDNNNNNNEVSEKVYSVPGENGKPRLKLRATARQLAGKDRQNAYDIKMAAKTAVEKIFSIYDVDNSGYLDPKELKSLLTKYNDGVAPDDETIIFIIRICDHEDEEKGQEQVGIHRKELSEAIAIAKAYLKNEGLINNTFTKYNAETQNALDHDQVRKLLMAFNNGKKVSESDIKFVCQHAAKKTDTQMKAEGEKALEIERLNLKAAVMSSDTGTIR